MLGQLASLLLGLSDVLLALVVFVLLARPERALGWVAFFNGTRDRWLAGRVARQPHHTERQLQPAEHARAALGLRRARVDGADEAAWAPPEEGDDLVDEVPVVETGPRDGGEHPVLRLRTKWHNLQRAFT